MLLGIDEVGRGPWAGPLVVGAVVLGDYVIDGLTDSKKLTKRRREELDATIRSNAAGYGLGWVQAKEIDQIGLSEALRIATRRAVEQVTVPYHEIIIDGTVNFLANTSKGAYVTTLKKADLLVPSVSAASIIAKVARDNYMAEQDALYPGYVFGQHVGYGTARHRAAIEQHGVTPLHRLSFAPLAKYRDQETNTLHGQKNDILTTKIIGDHAEDVVEVHLADRHHKVIERNWRTKYCEIDIVTKCRGKLYFTEVKYRRSNQQGGGVAAITHEKLLRMRRAAVAYLASHPQVASLQPQLAVATVTGTPPIVEEWFPLDL